MKILKEQTNDLLAVIKINLQPEDYRSRVDEVVKKYQRTASIPGFRPGKVPSGMIKKMYGKSVLVEELNKLLSDSLGKYIHESKLDVIGNPLPLRNDSDQLFEDGKEFNFSYEVGLAPQFEVKISAIDNIPFYKVAVDDKMVEDDLSDLRRRYGKFSSPEVSEEANILYGDFEELDENGNVKEGANKTTTTVSIEMIKDEVMRKPFLGLKKDETVVFNPMKTLANETEVSAMLKVEKSSPALSSDYKFTIRSINKIEKAELNQELFDKIYGEGNVESEEEFRTKIREGISQYFERESDKKLRKDIRTELLTKLEIPLPDEFLMRMIKTNAEKEINEHEFEHQYFHLAEDLRWDLIRSYVSKANNLNVTEEEVTNLAHATARQQFAQYGQYDVDETKVEQLAKRILSEGDYATRFERAIVDDKVFEVIKSQAKLEVTELPYEEFIKKLNEKTEHEVEHHH